MPGRINCKCGWSYKASQVPCEPLRPQWPDDHDLEPPTERTSNVLAWAVGAVLVVVVVCLLITGAQ